MCFLCAPSPSPAAASAAALFFASFFRLFSSLRLLLASASACLNETAKGVATTVYPPSARRDRSRPYPRAGEAPAKAPPTKWTMPLGGLERGGGRKTGQPAACFFFLGGWF